jgi:NTE family protein
VAGRALVLGGGGVTGIAWELGLLAGLAQAGVELAEADIIIGTSAGAAVAAQITGGTGIERLYEAQLRMPRSEVGARLGIAVMAKMAVTTLRSRDEQAALARLGRAAMAATTVPEAERRAIIAGRLASHEWPVIDLRVTAVAADDGEFVVFDRDSGVSLVDAVAASCAVPLVWPPITINGRRYMDGGMRSPANIDLAAGHERVVVLAPTTRALRHHRGVAAQLAALPASVRALAISPDQAAAVAIGRNVLDPARRPAAAQAGRRQAGAVLARVAEVWSG